MPVQKLSMSWKIKNFVPVIPARDFQRKARYAYAGERRPSFADSPLFSSLVFIGCNRVIIVIIIPSTLNAAHFFVARIRFYFCVHAFYANAIDPGHRYGNFPSLLQDIRAMLKKIQKKKK